MVQIMGVVQILGEVKIEILRRVMIKVEEDGIEQEVKDIELGSVKLKA